MKKLTFLIVLLIMGMTFLGAQTIAEYTFSNTTDGTLEDMTGSTALLAAGTYYDDTASPVTNIGFTFAFGLGGYTQFSANSNGQMQLGATAISGSAVSPAVNTPRLAPLSGDNAIRATGKLHYKLVGTSPNRKLVVEWLDLRVNYSSSTETGTYCRMQAWLYEGSNNIKFVYGTMWNMSTSTQARGVYVSTSNVAGSVGNVTDIIGAMTWTNTGTSVVTTTFPASSAMANLNSAAEGSRRVFSINYPVYTTPPNPAVLVSPANGLWTFTDTTLNWTSGGGGATSYDVYFGTSATPPFVGNQGGTSYTPTLAAGTTYYWNIVARNSNGAAAPTATWSFKTPTATQLVESFENTTFPPVGWARTTASTSYWSRNTSYYKQGVASMYAYTNTSANYNVSTPRVTIVAGSKLNFWAYASSTSQVLQIMYSPDRTTWTQIGSNITFAAASTWYNLDIDLSAYAGNNYYLGFNTPIHTTTGSVYVDMVFGPDITPEAPGAPVLSTPADLAVNVNEYPTLTWTAPTTGGVPTGYKVYLDTNTTPTTQIGTVTGLTWTATTPLAYNTVYYWTVKATNGAGDSPAATVRSFTTRQDPTITSLPYTDGFEVDNTDATAVASWSNVYVTGTKNWTANSSVTTYNRAPRTGTFNAFLGWSASTWMIRPVQLTGGTSYDVEVYARQDYADVALANMTIAYGTAGTAAAMTNVIVPQTGLTNGDYQRLGGSFTPASTGIYYIGILGTLPSATNWYVSIDDITIRQTPANPSFSYAPTAIDFGMVQNAAQVGPQNVTVTNTGGGTLNLTAANLALSGANAAQFSFATTNLPAALGAGQSVVIPVYVTGTTAGPISATLTITYNATPYTVALSANVLPAGIVTVGNGTADLDLPINAYYGYTYSQSIFLQSELNTPDQRIEKIWYYWNGAAEAVDSNDWTIYMGHTALTAFDTNTSWIPLINLSTVFTGTVALPAVEGWIEIPLSAPFVYNNTDNLVIAVDENADSYDGSSQYFYGTASATNRSLRYYSDGTNPDPAAPVAGTLVLGYPNLMLQFGDLPVGAPDAVTLTSPADAAIGLPIAGFNLTWTPASTGGVPTHYTVYLSDSEGEILQSEFNWTTVNTYFNPITEGGFEYNYEDVWYWTVKAVNASGEAVATPFSFTIQSDPTIVELPYEEYFDGVTAPALPYGWTGYVNSTSTSAYVRTYNSTTYAQSAPNSAYLTNSSDTAADLRLITPIIDATIPLNTIKLKFYARGGSAGYPLLVGTVNATDGTGVFTQLQSIALTATKTEYSVSFADYVGTDQYICFKHGLGGTYRSIYVDNVQMTQLVPNDLAATAITGITTPIVGTPVTHTVYITNNGTADQSGYTVYLKSVDPAATIDSYIMPLLAAGASTSHDFTWTPPISGSGNIYGEVYLSTDTVPDNNITPNLAITVYPAGTWVEGFESGAIPGDWTIRSGDGGTQNWAIYNQNPHSGTYCAAVRWETSTLANDDWLITPPLQLSATEVDNISFWLGDFSTTYSEEWQVWVSTTTNEIAAFTMIDSGSLGSTFSGYEQKTYNLDTYGNAVVYIAIRYIGLNKLRFYADDFVGPALYTPASPAVNIETVPTGVRLFWTASPYAKHYKIYADTDPYGLFNSTPIITTTPEYIITATEAKMFYKVVVSTLPAPSKTAERSSIIEPPSLEELEKQNRN